MTTEVKLNYLSWMEQFQSIFEVRNEKDIFKLVERRRVERQQARKEGKKEGRKDGRKEGRRSVREEERKEGRIVSQNCGSLVFFFYFICQNSTLIFL